MCSVPITWLALPASLPVSSASLAQARHTSSAARAFAIGGAVAPHIRPDQGHTAPNKGASELHQIDGARTICNRSVISLEGGSSRHEQCIERRFEAPTRYTSIGV